MRNALLISSILLLAVSCKRDDSRSDMGQGTTTTTDTTGTGGTAMDRSGQPGAGPVGGTAGTGAMEPSMQPGTAQPGTEQPAQPGTAQPGTAQPGTTQPGTTQPAQPGTAQPAEPGTAQPGTTQPGTTGMAGGDAGMDRSGQAAAGKMVTCDELVTASTRNRYLARGTVTDVPTSAESVAMCRIEGAGLTQAAAIQATCDQGPAMTATQMQQSNPDGQMLANVGKAAVMVETGETKQVTAVDDDSNCQINVTVPKEVDAVALSRELLKSLPAEG